MQHNITPGLIIHTKDEGTTPDRDARHPSMVDRVDGGDSYIKLTKDVAGNHHWIPINWVEKVDGSAVYLNKTEKEFRAGVRNELPREGFTRGMRRKVG